MSDLQHGGLYAISFWVDAAHSTTRTARYYSPRNVFLTIPDSIVVRADLALEYQTLTIGAKTK